MREEKRLSACLMDSDIETRQGRGARRRRAIIAAVAIEVVLIAWLLLWPVLTPGGLPPNFVMLPHIYPVRTADNPPAKSVSSVATRPTNSMSNPNFPPLRTPPRAEAFNSEAPPGVVPPLFSSNLPAGTSLSPWILGATGNGRPTIPPPRPIAPRMIRRSEGVESGMLIHRVEPLYPPLARAARISGTVELRAVIGRDGRVRSIEVLSGNPLLARAAIDAVWQWRYRPASLDGEAVEVETRITVNFVLRE